jgi:hypothetical protein
VLVACAGLAAAQPLADFQLPAKKVFSPAMPRYPNAWFYIDQRLAPAYDAAVKLVTEGLRTRMHLPEFFPPFDNPEGCDFEVHIEHLQPWSDRTQRARQHAHSFHMRYYYTALDAAHLGKVRLVLNGKAREFYRFAVSVHYEVEHDNPNHADVESCPICGRTGVYSDAKGNLVEQAHDPLGLELLLTGKIRGEVVHFYDWERRAVGSVESLRDKYGVTVLSFPGQIEDKNTARIGIVLLEPKPAP